MGAATKSCTEPARCRSCGAEILWMKWPRSGKPMPVDAVADMREPEKGGGKIVLTLKRELNELHGEVFNPKLHDAKRNRYTSHFATCPNANQHRKGED